MAAAAAAEDKLPDEDWDLRKAWLAALCADCDDDSERGCMSDTISMWTYYR